MVKNTFLFPFSVDKKLHILLNSITPKMITAVRTNHDGIYVKTCQIVVHIMPLNNFDLEFAPCNYIKIVILPAVKLYFYIQYVMSRKGPLMHNTIAYTSHVQNINTVVIVKYQKYYKI